MPGSRAICQLPNPNLPLVFNSFSYDPANDQIIFNSEHNFNTGDSVWFVFQQPHYYTTGPKVGQPYDYGEIKSGLEMFVVVSSPTAIKIALTKENALSGTTIDIPQAPPEFSIASILKVHIATAAQSVAGFMSLLPNRFPANIEAEQVFSSDVPVEVEFTVSPYPALAGNVTSFSFGLAVNTCLFKQDGIEKYWGVFASIPDFQNTRFRVINGSTSPTGTSYDRPGNVGGGYSIRYRITETRAIEYWVKSSGSSAYTLIFSSSQLQPGVQLRLQHGSPLPYLNLEKCIVRS